MMSARISLILVSVLLIGCADTSPNTSSVAKPDVTPLGSSSADRLEQYQISLESGLRYHAPELFDVPPPHQSNIAASSVNPGGLNYSRWNRNTFGDAVTNSYDQNQAFLKFFADCRTNSIFCVCGTNLVFNGSPPHPSQIFASWGDRIGLDCRGRDMSLIDDTAAK